MGFIARNIGYLAAAGALSVWMPAESGGAGAKPADWQAEYRIDVWQTEAGLPANTVSSIVQTRDGYIWVGTFGGLARFDGVEFTVMGSEEFRPLRHRRITCLLEDRAGNLWIGTEGSGVFRYQAGGHLTQFTTQHGLAGMLINLLAEDPQGNVWIATLSGLNRYRDGALSIYRKAEGLPHDAIRTLFCEPTGRVLIGTELGFCSFQDGVIHPLRFEEEDANREIMTAFVDRDGGIWVGTHGLGLFRRDSAGTTAYRNPNSVPDDVIFAIQQSRQGDIWVGTKGGLKRFRGGQLETLSVEHGLSHPEVRTILEDREGNLWLGTSAGGLNCLKAKKVRAYTAVDGLTHPVAMSVGQDGGGRVWVGLNCGGLNYFARDRWIPFESEVLNSHLCIWPVLAGRAGGIWVGSWGSGLLHVRDGRVRSFGAETGLLDNVVLSLFEDRDGSLWVGTYQGGLFHFKGDRFERYLTDQGMAPPYLTSMAQDSEGRLWIGSNRDGLYRLQNGQLAQFEVVEPLSSSFVRTLYLDRQGTLWIGSAGGLSRLADGKLTNYTRGDGLLDEGVSQILEDDEGYLWLGTNRGIFRVPKQECEALSQGNITRVHAIQYGKPDGMPSSECTGGFQPAGWKAPDGKLWFSTVSGLAVVDPREVRRNAEPPPVLVEKVVVDGEAVPITEPVRVPVGWRRVEIHYAALTFVAPEKVRFKYKLEDLDKDWVFADDERAAYFSHLPPGHYRFRVAACNDDGVWNETGAVLGINVLPPFWQTRWFALFVGLVLLSAVAAAARTIATRKLRRRMANLEREHALARERGRISQDLHDDLGAKLTQITLLGELAKRDKAKAGEDGHLGKLTKLSREIVRDLDQIVWAVNPRNDRLNNLLDYIAQYAGEFFRGTPVRCRFDLPRLVPETPISGAFRHHLFLAVKESLNNVLKHAGATEVRIHVRLDNNQLTICVEDNGRGMPTASVSEAGDGLANMRARLAEVGGACRWESRDGGGVQVHFEAPLGDGP